MLDTFKQKIALPSTEKPLAGGKFYLFLCFFTKLRCSLLFLVLFGLCEFLILASYSQ